MITVENLHKRYRTKQGIGPWVLTGVNLTIPKGVSVALIGGNGAGKSTLLRLIAGVDHPDKGRIERRCRLSWPMGQGGLDLALSGRQNAKFICRLMGREADLADRLAYISDFSGLGAAFDAPVETYSSGMRSRLQFAMSLAFDFDVYISDEVTAAGDGAFRTKAAQAFKDLSNRAGLIMVAHDTKTLMQFCQSGIFLHGGKAHWFPDIADALKAYKDAAST